MLKIGFALMMASVASGPFNAPGFQSLTGYTCGSVDEAMALHAFILRQGFSPNGLNVDWGTFLADTIANNDLNCDDGMYELSGPPTQTGTNLVLNIFSVDGKNQINGIAYYVAVPLKGGAVRYGWAFKYDPNAVLKAPTPPATGVTARPTL